LKIRTKAVTMLQQKLQTKQDLEKISLEFEGLYIKNENLQQSIDNLLRENGVLG